MNSNVRRHQKTPHRSPPIGPPSIASRPGRASVRADGRFELHIHAEITNGKGSKIALFADGVALLQPGSPIVELSENIGLFASAEDYKWVNHLQVWGVGTVDLARQVIHVKGYFASLSWGRLVVPRLMDRPV